MQVASGGSWQEGAPCEVAAAPRYLASIQLHQVGPVLCAAFSPDGSHLVLADARSAYLFRLPLPTPRTAAVGPAEAPGSTKIPRQELAAMLPPGGAVAAAIANAAAAVHLLLAGPAGHVVILDITAQEPKVRISLAIPYVQVAPGTMPAPRHMGEAGYIMLCFMPTSGNSLGCSCYRLRKGHCWQPSRKNLAT